mgnify:CR=1 FL=1
MQWMHIGRIEHMRDQYITRITVVKKVDAARLIKELEILGCGFDIPPAKDAFGDRILIRSDLFVCSFSAKVSDRPNRLSLSVGVRHDLCKAVQHLQ